MNQSSVDLIIVANDLAGALKGLESFVFDNFSDTKIKTKDLSSLQGLVKAIQIMADKNAYDIERALDSGDVVLNNDISTIEKLGGSNDGD